MTANEINQELCRALGIDVSATTKVVFTIEAGKMPVVAVHRFVKAADADKLHTAVTMLELRPAEAEDKPKPAGYAHGGFLPPGKTYIVGEPTERIASLVEAAVKKLDSAGRE